MIKKKISNILVPVSSLVFAYVHDNEYRILRLDTFSPWSSWTEFLGSWLFHFMALSFVWMVSYIALIVVESKLGVNSDNHISPDDAINYFFTCTLVASFALYFLSGLPAVS